MRSTNSQMPPPYSEVPEDGDDLLTHLSVAAHRERHAGTSTEPDSATAVQREVERIRNFVKFVLSVDYQCFINASLSSSDRSHFTRMHQALLDLEEASPSARPTNAERQILAPYFWQYLHEPCVALGIPTQYVVSMMGRLTKYQTAIGGYKGCCFGILHNLGLQALADKLSMDRTVVIPKIISNLQHRQILLKQLRQFQALYFNKVESVEASTVPENNKGNFLAVQRVQYESNERGDRYEKARQDAARTSRLSITHWAAKVKLCTDGILHRRRQAQAGKGVTDPTLSWRGDGDVLPPDEPTPPGKGHMIFGWTRPRCKHVPELFENRPCRSAGDA